jgi:hypothetical protein
MNSVAEMFDAFPKCLLLLLFSSIVLMPIRIRIRISMLMPIYIRIRIRIRICIIMMPIIMRIVPETHMLKNPTFSHSFASLQCFIFLISVKKMS